MLRTIFKASTAQIVCVILGSAQQCSLEEVHLRSNLSRKLSAQVDRNRFCLHLPVDMAPCSSVERVGAHVYSFKPPTSFWIMMS